MVRLFVSGLPPGTTCEQVQARFSAFGSVTGCEVAPPKTYAALPHDGGFYRGFGFVELEPHDDAALRKCVAAYNGSKWRGHVLKCQVAKPDYKQLLQEEWQQGEGEEQEGARRRALSPLEPGATLRLRHPSKPTTMPVQLASGQRLTSFPPAPAAPAGSGACSSWEPLPQPPGARYRFEAHLREVAERAPAPPATSDDDDARPPHASRGAAIAMQYPPMDSPGGAGGGAGEEWHPQGRQQRQQPGAAGGLQAAHPALQPAQLAPQPPVAAKKRKVVDFFEGDEEWASAGRGGLSEADLSRFASDSEEEQQEGGGLRGIARDGRAPGLLPAPAAEPRRRQPQPPAAGQAQQPQHQRPRPQQQRAGQAAKSAGRVQPGGMELARGKEEEEAGQLWAATPAPDLSRFGSDSGSEGEGLGGPAIDMQPMPPLLREQQQQQAQERRQPPQRKQARAAAGAQAVPRGPHAPAQPVSPPAAAPQGEPHAAAALQGQQQQRQQGRQQPPAQRAVIDFLTPADAQQLSKRAAVDLSRFASDSDSEEGGVGGGGAGRLLPAARQARGTAGGARMIPQVDGTWDSEEEEEDGSGEGSSEASEGEEEGCGRASSSSSSGRGSSGESSSSGSEGEGSQGSGSDTSGSSSDEEDGEEEALGRDAARPELPTAAGRQQQQPPKQAGGAASQGEEGGAGERGEKGGGTQPGAGRGAGQPAAPAWLARLLPAGAGFCRQERLELVEASWRVSREGLAQDYRTKHRQAVRHLSRPAGKKQRRK